MKSAEAEAHAALMDLCGMDAFTPTAEQRALRSIVFAAPVVRSFDGRGARASLEQLQQEYLHKRVRIQATDDPEEVRRLAAWLVKVDERLANNQSTRGL